MADVASGSINLDYYPNEVYKAATDPANPTDGQLVYNTTQNVLKQWNATTEAYVVIADYDTMNTQLGAVQAVTTGSTDFLGLLASATYTENRLLLSGINAILQLLLGPAGIYFKDTGEVVAYITGQVMHITSIEVDSIKIGPVTFIKTENGYIRK